MAGQNLKGLQRLKAAGYNSAAGIKACWVHEEAFRQEVILASIGIPLAFFVGNTPVERVLLVGSLLLLIIIELLNSAIEATIDRIGLEHHELSGRAKDISSAAVLFAVALTASTWLIIFL
ncbi:MAG: diacylglycerol kinase [Cycloclasticus sp.]|jgi:diacylglycerol kinase (ATP)|nr:MAG: diacylglycerol kinase [Cycloclasticus sp. Phe_18]MBV1912911.1 diacylglycerol kinase [Cycloclasticus sp.]MDF1689214.1 diacylglycerol kinase [Cycloclasticus sp.]MEE4291606.1 diacylglycerol kinase [Cycloclasticus sp.]